MANEANAEKVRELKQFIAKHPDASPWCKKVVFWLIDQSNGFTRNVSVIIPGTTGLKVAYGVHDMNSALCEGPSLCGWMDACGLSWILKSWSYNSEYGGVRAIRNRNNKLEKSLMLEYDYSAIKATSIRNF